MPTLSRQDLDNTHFHLTITLSRDELKPKLDAEFKRYKQKAQIKGFRAGQAPANYVKAMYGTSIFYEVFNKLMSDALYGYLRDENIDALGQPLPVDENKKYAFKIDSPEESYDITYEIGHVPKFEIAGLGKEAEYSRFELSDLDTLAAADLEDMRRRGGERTNPEDGIEENDIIRVAVKEQEADADLDGGWETTVTIFVKNINDPALMKEVLTLKKGDTLAFNVNQLEAERDEEFIRKYILNVPADDARVVGDNYRGTIEEVSRVGVAELNEAFFHQHFGENVNTEAEAIEEIKKGVAQYYESRANALVMREMQDRLIEQNNIELPKEFLKRWLAISNEGTVSAESIENEYDSFATSLRWSLLRDRMKEMFNVVVTEGEIRQEFINTLRNYFKANLPDELLKTGVDRMMQDKKEVERVSSNIEYEKMFGAAIETVTLVPKLVTSAEFHAEFERVKNKVDAESEA
jgi:trigger factor